MSGIALTSALPVTVMSGGNGGAWKNHKGIVATISRFSIISWSFFFWK